MCHRPQRLTGLLASSLSLFAVIPASGQRHPAPPFVKGLAHHDAVFPRE